MIKLRFTFVLIAILFVSNLHSQNIQPFIKNFTPKDYGKENNVQNWSVNQDNRGILYFGNNLNLLEYDGEEWNSIKATHGYITSILTTKTGNIYVGSQGEFGVVKPNSDGIYQYENLSDRLPEDEKMFGNIWKTLEYKSGVLFFSQEKLFFLKNDSLTIIKPKTTFHTVFVIDDKLFVRQREYGIMLFNGKDFDLIPNGDIFKDYGVFGMYINPKKDEIFISTQELGFYKFANNEISKIETKDETFLNNSRIFGGKLLNDGKIALTTALQGVIIIDFNANIKAVYNKKNGLLDNDIKQIFQDKYDNLWVAMGTGIAKINYSSIISYFNTNSGINGRVKSICKFKNKIFVGTSAGLFVEDTTGVIKKFNSFSNFNENTLNLINTGNQLIVATNENLYYIENEKFNLINRVDASATFWSDNKQLLYVVGQNGLQIYSKKSGNWSKIASDDWLFIHNALSIVEEKLTDSTKTSLWVGSLNEGVVNYIIDKDLNINFTQYAGEVDGLVDGSWAKTYISKKELLVGTVNGLMSFISAETMKEIANDTSLTDIKGLFDLSDLYSNTSAYTSLIDKYNRVWSCIDGKVVIQDNDKIIDLPFKSLDLGNIRVLYPENENKLWIGGDNGLAFINLSVIKDFKTKPNINIRKLTISIDSVIFAGVFYDELKNIVINKQETNKINKIDFSLNTLTIKFASTSYTDGKKVEYSFFLKGYDDNWSEWSTSDFVNYKKITNGTYTFMVKSRDIYSNESNVAEYSFVILPPWYKTIWAFIFYFVFFIFLIFAIVKLSIKRLKAKNEELERIVQERTKEIAEQRDELAEQKQEIEDSISYAQRIQQAVLPHDEYIEEIINDFFILFRPKDVVSGDFYWTLKIDDKIIITAADCTGHGVPGAFMSMLGMSFLNQIVRIEKHIHANEILCSLRTKIIDALKQKGEISEQKDGMDMALCVIDTKTNKVEFSGANNPLYVVSKSKKLDVGENTSVKLNEGLLEKDNGLNLFEVKPDKMPIAIYVKMDEFVNNKIQLQKGDCIYMFSDGYADQFGGPKGKKFKYKPFKRLILGNSQKPMIEQQEILEKSFVEWHKGIEQIDDVVVIGLRI